MKGAERVAVFAASHVRESVASLGFEPVSDGARVALVDLGDGDAVHAAEALEPDVTRVFICPASHTALLAAIGIPRERVSLDAEPAALGPLLLAAFPRVTRSATRSVAVTGARGGVGRTLLVTNLARRLARRLPVCAIDATGTGAAGWWLRCAPRAWAELEALADELSAEQLAIVASESMANLRVVGGIGSVPSPAILEATIRAATHLDDLVIVDLPTVFDATTRAARERVDRVMVLAYDDPTSLGVLDAGALGDAWLIASQSSASRVGSHEVFRALPRDDASVRAAMGQRAAIGGALGRAYDDLAELLLIDAS